MNFIRKTLIWFFIFSLVIYPQTSLAIKIIDYPSPTEAMNQIIGDLGVDKTELKKNINDSINVGNYKKNPPAVTLSFIPESPVPGKELTAVATPSYFTGNPKQMYFTWYLKREECKKARKGEANYVASCNLNDDNKVDIDDWKIEAMKLLATSGEDPASFDYDTAKKDDDGYEASFGGDDQRGKPAHCYVRDVESGIDYEMGLSGTSEEGAGEGECSHLFPDTNGHGTVGDGEFGRSEEKFWGTNPESKDTNNDGVPDEEALTGKGMMQFKWLFKEGDQVGVAVEGVTENTDYQDSSLKTMWAFPLSSDNGNEICDIKEPENPPSTDQRGIYTFDAHGSYYCGGAGQTCTLTLENCHAPGTIDETATFANPGGTPGQASYPPCDEQSCPNGRYTGSFFLWKAGRENPNHELRVLINSSYPDACRVCIAPGVSIEDEKDCEELEKRMGQSENTAPVSNTNLNECLENNLIDPAQGTADKKIEINLTYSPQSPINDPRGQDKTKENNSDTLNIKANLSNIENKSFVKYEWKFWLCEEGEKKCVSDSDDPNVPISAEGLRQNFSLLKASGMGMDIAKLKLQIDPNKSDYENFRNKNYLKAEVQAYETTEKAEGKFGKSTVLIRLYKSQQDIIPYDVEVINEPSSEIGFKLNQKDPRYANLLIDCPDKVCSVVKNEIIGLAANIPDGYDSEWSLNGKPLLASEKKPGLVYFPILQNAGSKYSVRLNLSNEKEKISLIRDFKVEDPKATIVPGCVTGGCILPNKVKMGTFILDQTDTKSPGATMEDLDSNLFQAQEASTVTVQPTFNFDSSVLKDKDGNLSIEWFVDGIKVNPAKKAPFPYITPITGELNIPINKRMGDKYAVSMKALYTQPDMERRALHYIWGVPTIAFYETTISDSAEIEVIAASQNVSTGTTKIMASLFSLLPDYINFLFRIVLTIGLILFSTGLLLSVFPKQKERQM